MVKRLLLAVPLALLVTGGLFLAMRVLTDPPAERVRIIGEESPEIELGRTIRDTGSMPKPVPEPKPVDCPPRYPGSDGCAMPIVRPKPHYPDCAAGRGEVLLDFAVETDGSVSDIRVILSDSDCIAAEAVRAAAKWRYRPMVVDGEPERSRTRVRIIFEPE